MRGGLDTAAPRMSFNEQMAAAIYDTVCHMQVVPFALGMFVLVEGLFVQVRI
jgi:hypothetical protein